MEVKLEVLQEEINEDLARESDNFIRMIYKRFPHAVWQRDGDGWKILI